MALRKIVWHGAVNLIIHPDGYRIRTYPVEDQPQVQPQQQVLATDKRPGTLPAGWHKVEISAVGRSLVVALDGNVLCKEDKLPAVARGDTFIWAWPGKAGGKHEYRNIMIAQLDKETTAGTFDGIIMEKAPKPGTDYVGFKADGEDVPRRFSPPPLPGGGPDLQVLDAIKGVVTLNRAKLSWKLQPDGQPAVVGIQLEVPPPNGTLVGTITHHLNNCIEVKPDNGPPERFLPRWIGGMPNVGGGLDKAVVQILSKFKLGDRVKVTWIYVDRKLVTNVEPAP
jgi:hypothetical protein